MYYKPNVYNKLLVLCIQHNAVDAITYITPGHMVYYFGKLLVLCIQHNAVDAITYITPGHMVYYFCKLSPVRGLEWRIGAYGTLLLRTLFGFFLLFTYSTLLWAVVFISHRFTWCVTLISSAGSEGLTGIPMQVQQRLCTGLSNILL